MFNIYMWASSHVRSGLIHISTHLQEISFSALLPCSRSSWDMRRRMKKISQMVKPFSSGLLLGVCFPAGRGENRRIGMHEKRRKHVIKNASRKRPLIKRLLCLPLPQVGGVLCLVLNSQFFHDASACPQLQEAQEAWLEDQLSRASLAKVQHNPDLVFALVSFRSQVTAAPSR